MLDKFAINQIWSLLHEGCGIRTVARMTGVARNTVRRSQRNMPSREAWAAIQEARRLALISSLISSPDEEETLRDPKN
ncbi:MAG TPA: hypothetical protein H9894_05050 [Candidatus Desulfovibrio intestinipullorum]|uniref:Helix-turn-helix domain-containing protein n=1 Tax=Candidatus Desulfovibrio intestinipullorum TaxID=2838536 RepID=A0A9D1PX68_9BACT|nr:hypothetical protein [Candidatus Desulfovibrio intestinipullorum]